MDIMEFNMAHGIREMLESDRSLRERMQAAIDEASSRYAPGYFSEEYSCLYLGDSGEIRFRLD